MTHVLCIDGSSGSFRGSRLSQHVKLAIRRAHLKVSAHYYRSSVLPIFSSVYWWRVRQCALRYARPANTLLLAGKSLGAIWALDVLKLSLDYAKIVLVTVDPHNPVGPTDVYMTTNPAMVAGWNIYQTNRWPQGGRIAHSHVINTQISGHMDHWTILDSQDVSDALDCALDAARGD